MHFSRALAGFWVSGLLVAALAHAAAKPAKSKPVAPAPAPAVETPVETRGLTAEDLTRLDRVSEPTLSPDGQKVAFTLRETDAAANRGRMDLWVLDLAAAKPMPRRVTSHPENDSGPQWSPDGHYLYFLSERSGSGQIWRLPIAGGEAEQITNFPVEVGTFKVSPDGTRIAFSAEVFPDCESLACTRDRLKALEQSPGKGMVYERLFVRHWTQWSDGRQAHLFVLKLDNGKPSGDPVAISGWLDADVPSKPFGDASEYNFTPDSNKIVFSARLKGKSEPWSTNFDLYEVAVDGSAEPANLTAENPAWDARPIFSPDGSLMAWLAMDQPGFESDRFHIVVRDLRTGERRALTRDWDRSVDAIAFAADSKSIYATADQYGQHPLWSVDMKSGKPTMLTGPGSVESFTVGKDRVVVALADLKSPTDLYGVTPKNGEIRQLTQVNAAKLAGRLMGQPEQFTFAGANSDVVHGYVMRPAQFDPQAKYPVAFIVHGGPQASFANQWSYRWNPQTYAGAGYASVFIDFHGSPGYGQAFTNSISGDGGGKPLEDLKKGLAAALAKYPWLDGERSCALGASYGGFMINWIAGHWQKQFKCLVNHAGIFDAKFMAYSTEELWFQEWEFGGPPYEAPQLYDKFNPINSVAQWQTPMLVIHGQKDYRVPYSQGLATFTALQRRGIDSRLLIFPDEGHWVLKPGNSLQWHKEVLRWLDQYLKQ